MINKKVNQHRKPPAIMRKLLLIICAVVFNFFIYQNSFAQDSLLIKKDSSLKPLKPLTAQELAEIQKSLDSLFAPTKSYFQAGINYLSNNVYLGRKDTIAIPYINASVGYYHKSGLYVSGAASYLPNANPGRFDLFTIGAGYLFKIKKFEGQVNADKYFYSSQSINVKSAIKESFDFFAAYNFGFIKITATPTLIISNESLKATATSAPVSSTESDFALMLGIEHTFYLLNSTVDITPTINANGSTQNYYNIFYRARKSRIKKNGQVVLPANISAQVDDAAQFKILDYEFTSPINYVVKKFTFNFTPVYAIAVHPALLTITTQVANRAPRVVTHPEKISNSFFFQAGITYKF